MLNCGTPFMHAFMPLVPLASSGFRGIVQPDVAALDQKVGDVQVVVLDEGDAPGKDRVERATENALQVVLAGVVGRMGLAGKDDLHRPARRVQDASQPIGIAEDERGTFVAGEPAGESQRERVVVQHRAGRQHTHWR